MTRKRGIRYGREPRSIPKKVHGTAAAKLSIGQPNPELDRVRGPQKVMLRVRAVVYRSDHSCFNNA